MSRVEGGLPRAQVVVRPQERTILTRRTPVVVEWTEIDLIVDGKLDKRRVANKFLTERGYRRRVKRKKARAERRVERVRSGGELAPFLEESPSVSEQTLY